MKRQIFVMPGPSMDVERRKLLCNHPKLHLEALFVDLNQQYLAQLSLLVCLGMVDKNQFLAEQVAWIVVRN